MKNSRRSDRELARAVGVSQPTVSRLIKKLEKDGVIKEYTMIPGFKRLGFELMGISFIRTVLPEGEEELKKAVAELEENSPYASLMAVNGMGMGKCRAFITLYRNYSRYMDAMRIAKSLPHAAAEGIESFLVDLNDESNYRLFTLQQTARNIQTYIKVVAQEPAKKSKDLKVLS